MKLIDKQLKALKLSIEMWEWLAETGGTKEEWFTLRGIDKKPFCGCYLCQYFNKDAICEKCPLSKEFQDIHEPCMGTSCFYHKWEFCSRVDSRRRYAKLFRNELYECYKELLKKKESSNVKEV